MSYDYNEIIGLVKPFLESENDIPVWFRIRATPRMVVEITCVFSIVGIPFHFFFGSTESLVYFCAVMIAVVVLGYLILSIFYEFVKGFTSVMLGIGSEESELDVSSIYVSRDAFQVFQKESVSFIFQTPRKDILSIVFGLILYWSMPVSTILSYILAGEFSFDILFMTAGIFQFPFSPIVRIIEASFWTVIVVVLMSGILTLLRILWVTHRFNHEESNLTLFNAIEEINRARIFDETEDADEDSRLFEMLADKGQFSEFQQVSSKIVSTFMKVTLLILLVAIAISMLTAAAMPSSILVDYRFLTGQLSAIFAASLGVILFVFPQLRLHSLMDSYKRAMISLLQDIHEQDILKYVFSGDIDRTSLGIDIKVVKQAMDYHKELDVWPYSGIQLAEVLGSLVVIAQSGIIQLLLIAFSGS